MKNCISQYISKLGDKALQIGKADQEKINDIEENLHVCLPNSYKWFLSEFGVLMIPGHEIEGNGLAQTPSCVRATKDWREFGLPHYMIVVEELGELVYCLDTSRIENGECPVVDWEPHEGTGNEYFLSFLSFLNDRLIKSINEFH